MGTSYYLFVFVFHFFVFHFFSNRLKICISPFFHIEFLNQLPKFATLLTEINALLDTISVSILVLTATSMKIQKTSLLYMGINLSTDREGRGMVVGEGFLLRKKPSFSLFEYVYQYFNN